MYRWLGAAVGAVLVGAVVTAVALASTGPDAPRALPAATPPPTTTLPPPTSTSTTSTSTTTTSTTSTTTTLPPTTTVAPAVVDASLAGCPVPPGPKPPPTTPWHPATLVPDSSLPQPSAPAPWASDRAPVEGKGMWIWEWNATEGGRADAVVKRALAAGLHQVWVRVGDSMNGFYGAAELAALVPPAHAAGLAVIAWGFPYLYDPAGDAAWTAQILDWHTSSGQRVDGYSADLERASEGVDLTAQRAGDYLASVRQAAGNRTLVATVYPPTNTYWTNGAYPYAVIARYVDVFAPMVYWECTDPGTDASEAVARLGTLRPVHVIGQAFNLAGEGGRTVSPTAGEVTEFMTSARRAGALGASFWVWQSATAEEWNALSAFRW